MGKPEGQKKLGRSRRRWENNIRIDMNVMEREGVDWINLTHYTNMWQDLVKTVTHL
jgi:hypothetical protein